MHLISVVVPVFRAEKCLSRCIDSILAQTYTNFELILVNDGSPDNSGAICDEYAKKDIRISVIHKQNAGVSAARNTGLDNARGVYITFIDSDDFVDSYYLEKLLSAPSDLTVCGSYITSVNGDKSVYIRTDECIHRITKEQIVNWFDSNYLKYVWGKLFKRSIIEENNLRFDSRISLGEDVVFVVQYALFCKTCASVQDILYYYVKYPGVSTLTQQLTPHMVISNDLRDQMLNDIFHSNGIISKVFNSSEYVSKRKMKHFFFAVFENPEISILQKHKWYHLFFSLPIYRNNIDILTCDCSKTLRWVIKKKSSTLLLIFQAVAKIKGFFKK